MARVQKAEDQRREGLVERVLQKPAWASWRVLLAPKLLECKVTLHKVGLKASQGCQGKHSQSSHRTERSSDSDPPDCRVPLEHMGHSVQMEKG